MSNIYTNIKENNGVVVEVKGATTSEKIQNYFVYLNELTKDQTGCEMSIYDALMMMESEEFKGLFD